MLLRERWASPYGSYSGREWRLGVGVGIEGGKLEWGKLANVTRILENRCFYWRVGVEDGGIHHLSGGRGRRCLFRLCRRRRCLLCRCSPVGFVRRRQMAHQTCNGEDALLIDSPALLGAQENLPDLFLFFCLEFSYSSQNETIITMSLLEKFQSTLRTIQ